MSKNKIFYYRKSPKTPTDKEKAGKKPRVWELGGNNKDLPNLDRSKDKPEDAKSDYTVDNEVGKSFSYNGKTY